jgi:uncharacterized protein (TIGR04255 family)
LKGLIEGDICPGLGHQRNEPLSDSASSPYVGWSRFQPELFETVDQLFSKAGGLTIRRLGLRYLNALTKERHGLSSIADLNMKLMIGKECLSGNVNVNFTKALDQETKCTVRVATPDFVQGSLPSGTSAYVDVDVYTDDQFHADSADIVKQWITFAHDEEKVAFFGLLTAETIEALRED